MRAEQSETQSRQLNLHIDSMESQTEQLKSTVKIAALGEVADKAEVERLKTELVHTQLILDQQQQRVRSCEERAKSSAASSEGQVGETGLCFACQMVCVDAG